MLKAGEEYFTCRLCNEWTENEDEMRRHIALFHSAKGTIKDIYSAFGRFPKRISDIYEEIETCFEHLFGKECVTSGTYQRLFIGSMARIQRVVDEEFQILEGFINMQLDPSL